MAYRRPERVCNSRKKRGLSYIEKIFVKFLILLGVIFLITFLSLMSPSTPVTPSVSNSTQNDAIREQILQKVEDKWMSGIEEKYTELVEAYKADQKQKVLDLLEEFREHDKLDYIDVAEINRVAQTEKLTDTLNKTSKTDYKALYAIYSGFSELYPDNTEYGNYAAACKEEYEKEEARIVEERKLARIRKERVESQFSSWDGSHRNFTKFIKDSMHDPSSYKHVETKYSDYGKYILVRTKFRGTNAFGGTVTNTMAARFTVDGQLIEIVENE